MTRHIFITLSLVGGSFVGGALVGCTGTSGTARFDDASTPGTTPDGSSTPDPNRNDASFATDAPVGDDCTDAARLVYLFTDQGQLYSFDPPSKAMTLIGALKCNSSGSPNSMAVSRDSSAYVNYSDGSIHKVDTKTLACAKTPFGVSGWTQMGMGFSTNGTASKDETLFVAKTSAFLTSSELASLSIPTMKMTNLGAFDSTFMNLSPELTGTGDARLYGFFVDSALGSSAKLAELNKNNATAVTTVPLSKITSVSAWAISFWGGDFYLYYATGTSNSKVGRYRPSDKTFVDYMSANFRIVGAGVSTCAPTTPR